MNRELYDLAYSFRNAKLWKVIFEDELFAVKLPNKQIGYCSLMGRSGQHMALGVYIGQDGFSSYRKLISYSGHRKQSASYPVELLTQDCIQCSIERRDQFSPEELADIKAYCEESGTSFRAPFPQFSRFYPYCVPWYITKKNDWKSLQTALEVMKKIGELLKTHSKEDLGLNPIAADLTGEAYINQAQRQETLFGQTESVTVPLFSLANGNLVVERIPLPTYKEPDMAPPTRFNELAVAKLMKLKKDGVLQCEVLRAPEPVEGEPPYVPALLLSVETDEGMVLRPTVAQGAQYDPNEMIQGFCEALLASGVYPRQITVKTKETATLLRPFCEKAKIDFFVSQALDALDEVAEQILQREENEDRLSEMLRMLGEMSVDQISQLPALLLQQMLEVKEMLPDNIAVKIEKALDGKA